LNLHVILENLVKLIKKLPPYEKNALDKDSLLIGAIDLIRIFIEISENYRKIILKDEDFLFHILKDCIFEMGDTRDPN